MGRQSIISIQLGDITMKSKTILMTTLSVILLMGLTVAGSYVDKSQLDWTQNPYTGSKDYIGGQNWSYIDNATYPAACPTYSAITALGTSTTCTDSWIHRDGDTVTGDYVFDTLTLTINSTLNRIGIGTTTPSESIELSNGILKVRNTTTIISNDTTNWPIIIKQDIGEAKNSTIGIKFGRELGDTKQAAIGGKYTSSFGNQVGIGFWTGGSSAFSEKMVLSWNGRLGIGTEVPEVLLDVSDDSIRIRAAGCSGNCISGEIAWNSTSICVCTSTNTWNSAHFD